MIRKIFDNRSDKLLHWLAIAIILAGIALRVIVWFQNRDLIIDESNIARNLYEKDFGQLAGHLSYEQYAPILFVWVEKLFSMLFGFSEKALKAYPLLCGIAALFVFMQVLRQLVSLRSLWYPMTCLAVAHFFIRYSTEIKQYMPDVLIILSLLLLALKTDIFTTNKRRFFIAWMFAGSIAVWSSMPSVFALAGVGMYYLWICYRSREMKQYIPFAVAGVIWAAQFLFYYFAFLAEDAHSDYLQNFHSDYFLVATPENYHEWAHNWYRVSELVKIPTGYSTFSKLFNFFLLFFGSFMMLKKSTAKGILVLAPLALTIAAAAINEFSVIPRVALFTMPLFLIPIAYGLDTLMAHGKVLLSMALIVMGCISLYENNAISMAWRPFYSEQITWGLQLMKDNNVAGKQLNVSHGSVPAFLYYTQIHPARQQWESLSGATIRQWDTDYGLVGKDADSGRLGVIFTTISDKDATHFFEQLSRSTKLVDSIYRPQAKSYAYVMSK